MSHYALSEGLTDPTRPGNISVITATTNIKTNNEHQTTFKLSQISIRNNHKTATINGQRVIKGDWLDNTTESVEVLDITQSGVRLLIGDTRIKILTIAPLIKEYHHP